MKILDPVRKQHSNAQTRRMRSCLFDAYTSGLGELAVTTRYLDCYYAQPRKQRFLDLNWSLDVNRESLTRYESGIMVSGVEFGVG